MCNSSCNFEFSYFVHLVRLLSLYMIVFLWHLLQPKIVFIFNSVYNILDNSLEIHWPSRNQLPLGTNKHVAILSKGTLTQQLRKCKAAVTHNISDLSYWCIMGMKMKSVPLTIMNRPWQTAFQQAIYMGRRHAFAFSPTYTKSGKMFKRLEESKAWKLHIGLHGLLLIYLWKLRKVY